MKKGIRKLFAAILVGAMALGLAACGGGNPVSTAPAADSGAATADAGGLKICIITSSGVDDGSFNENCYDGIKAFIANHSDCTVTDVTSRNPTSQSSSAQSRAL